MCLDDFDVLILKIKKKYHFNLCYSIKHTFGKFISFN